MDRDLAAVMNLYFADPATDSYDLKAEQSALARLKQVSGNAGSVVQYKPANRQDEADLRRNRRIELMKPVPVERLRFKCSCGAGDARADKASKTLTVTGKPAPCQETGVLIKSPPRNSPQRIDYSCSGGFFFAKKLPAGARTPEPMCSKMPIMTSLGFREFINVPDVPQNFARLAIRRSRLSRKKQGVLSHRQLTTLSTPPCLAKAPGFIRPRLRW